MRLPVIEFGGLLSLGGSEAAMCRWASSLAQKGYEVHVAAMAYGPRNFFLREHSTPIHLIGSQCDSIEELPIFNDGVVLHMHSPGYPFVGDRLARKMKEKYRGRCAIISTNIFGQLRNPAEDAWTDFRLFISWTSCVQAARRAGRKLDKEFFRRQSVAVYPVVDPLKEKLKAEMLKAETPALRNQFGIQAHHVLFGRFSRPEPNKWTPLVLDAFLAAQRENPNIRLLLREPPPAVAQHLTSSGLASWFSPRNQEPRTKNQEPRTNNKEPTSSSVISHQPVILLPATSDPEELTISQMACDVVLHTSSIGESFGYGIAEPMALGKPVITNSVPWHDQAQIELVRHGECGLIASTVPSMKAAILRMAENAQWRVACGELARKHVLRVADPVESTNRVEMAMKCAVEGSDNPLAEQDLEKARKTAEYLDKHQWGHSLEESWWLRSRNAKVQFFRWQRAVRNRMTRTQGRN